MAVRKFTPSAQQKVEALADICYEIEQLVDTTTFSTNDSVINNALVESRLIHLRTLIGFFNRTQRTVQNVAGESVEADDVLAKDYGFTGRKVEIDRTFVDRLNKDLAHLTYSRGQRRTELSKRWPTESTILPVLAPSQAFITHVRSSGEFAFTQEFTGYLDRLLRKVIDLQNEIGQKEIGA